jgi:hypothetical protein
VLFERIRKQVQALAITEGGHLQDPMATPVMGAQPELPFFHNPRYLPNPAAEAAAAVEPATAPFLDPALDEEHFRNRAAGHGPAAGRITAGCFIGRAPQLRQLAAWMDGDGQGGVTVVTGSPGAGKSALLGLLVCAAHPDLRSATQDLWRATAARPSENPELAAVHARQRTLPVILTSLAAQLRLDLVDAAEGAPTPQRSSMRSPGGRGHRWSSSMLSTRPPTTNGSSHSCSSRWPAPTSGTARRRAGSSSGRGRGASLRCCSTWPPKSGR